MFLSQNLQNYKNIFFRSRESSQQACFLAATRLGAALVG